MSNLIELIDVVLIQAKDFLVESVFCTLLQEVAASEKASCLKQKIDIFIGGFQVLLKIPPARLL